MTLIEKITRLKHPGVLRDFTWPGDLLGFGRFNVIYGWNGSGKTILSRLFRCLEQRLVPSPGQATICIDGKDIGNQDFTQTTIHVRVFNRDFVNENVFPVGGGDVPPIFVVGKESVEKQKELDRLRGDKSRREADLATIRATGQQAERHLEKHCTDQAKIIKDTLRVPGTGAYNEFDKRAYRKRAEEMAAAGDAKSRQLDDATHDNLFLQHRATIKPRVSEVEYRLPLVEQFRSEVGAILATTVTSSALQALKDDSRLGDWARQGLRLHKDSKSEVCLFCDQSLPADRLAVLEAHFSAEYDRFLQRVNEQLDLLKRTAKQASEARPPDRAALYEDMTAEYDSAELALRNALKKLRGFLDVLIQALEEKRGQAFRSIELDVAIPEIDTDVVNRLNRVIQRHNKASDDFHSRSTDARDRLALDVIAQSIGEYSRLAEAARVASDAIGPIEVDIQRLSGEVERLEQEIVEHGLPAKELNDDLHKYLGHDELRLEVRDTGYALMRHGVPADSLSEGERTALALLYFLKSLGDRRFDLGRGVVVLDDPVSSLDANALYLAFGFIRERTQAAGQLFFLTHNFTFFRQVRNWFQHLNRRKKRDSRPARFFMLQCALNGGHRSSSIRSLDPLLERYESEYHYLFACIHRGATQATASGLAENYAFPNMARRLLEMFLAFRRPQVAGELWQKLKGIDFDEAKKLRILRFVQTHSHGDSIGEPEHDPTLLGEAQAVLSDILEFIKSQDAGHFDAMSSLVVPQGESEVGE